MRVLARSLAVGVMCAAVLTTVSPASAHPRDTTVTRRAGAAAVVDAPLRLRSLAGSGKYLVYEKLKPAQGGDSNVGGVLYAMTAHGRPRSLGAVTSKDTAFSLAGSMLVYVHEDSENSQTVHWQNLTTGKHGTDVGTPDTVAAAPNGWVEVHHAATSPGAGVLHLHTASGATTLLGSPYPGGLHFALSVSATTLVAYSGPDGSGTNGTAVAMSFAKPGTFHRVVARRIASLFTVCPSVTSTFIACYTSSGHTASDRLYTATGKPAVHTTTRCANTPAALGGSIAWVTQGGGACPSRRLVIVARNGKPRTQPGRYAEASPVSAFGAVVVTSVHEDRLVLVSQTGRTRTLAKTT